MRHKLLGALLVASAACSDPVARYTCEAPGCDDVPGDTASDDAGAEVAVDVFDARPDLAEDIATDANDAGRDEADATVVIDVAADVTLDRALDVAPDVTPDSAVEPVVVARDSAPEAAMDATADIAADIAADVRAEAAVDAATDVRVDAATDVAVGGGCVSGAVGTHVARFRWTGSGSGSRATVNYEANNLPDRSRWRVTANSRSIGYTPVYTDTFLAEGGLDLEGTVFIDVELSTAGLTSLSGVTLAVYGRSFNTTTSGSFAWQTFSGRGAAPSGLVANSAPYQWYRADATTEFVPGDNGVLLRITAGPPSGALVVSRVEVCFNAR